MKPNNIESTIKQMTESGNEYDDDGVWCFDMESGEKRLILSLSALASMDPLPSMSGAEHYVNHLEFNADGSRFVFVHLWVRNGLRNSRLVSSDRDGGAVHILNNSGHTSHHCWKSNHKLLAFATHKETGMAYYEYVDRYAAQANKCSGIPEEDGHPSSLGNDLVMVDTYPDKYGEQCVYLCNTAKGVLKRVVSVYSKRALCGQYRCDLHHRVGPLRQHVCLDVSSCSLRSMHVYNVPELLFGEEVDTQ